MKERSRGKMAELLLEELLEQLRERGSIKEKLGDMTSLPVEELIEQLLDEFEAILEKRRLHSVEESRLRKERRSKPKQESSSATRPLFDTLPDSELSKRPEIHIAPPPPPSVPTSPKFASREESRPEETQRGSVVSPATRVDKVQLEFPPIPLDIPSLKQEPPVRPQQRNPLQIDRVAPKPADKEAKSLPKEKEMPPPKKEAERPAKAEPSLGKLSLPPEVEEDDDVDEEFDLVDEPEVETEIQGRLNEEVVPARPSPLQRMPYEFTDDDHVYLHAVVPIPENEKASEEPFMLEEKGIDGKNFAFALDYEGLRFYLSKFSPESMSVSKKGVLLLGKQETLQFQGVHESVVNDLRVHGTLLPFKFGSVARGRDRLLSMIDPNIDEIRESLAAVAETKWWTLNLYVLDSRIAQIVASQSATRGREREPQRGAVSQPVLVKKYDVTTLERILQKEKKIAEAIHEEMKMYAERSDVDSMVSLGSGSSEDWKLILKASYEVAGKNLPRFNRMVTDLQYHHMMFELMLALTGDAEAYSFE